MSLLQFYDNVILIERNITKLLEREDVLQQTRHLGSTFFALIKSKFMKKEVASRDQSSSFSKQFPSGDALPRFEGAENCATHFLDNREVDIFCATRNNNTK